MLKSTNTNVCTNQVKTRSVGLPPNNKPVPKERDICGAKLVRGDRRILLHVDNSRTVVEVDVGYVRWVK